MPKKQREEFSHKKPSKRNRCERCQCKDWPNCTEGEGDEQEMCYNCICKFTGCHFNFEESEESDEESEEDDEKPNEMSDESEMSENESENESENDQDQDREVKN